MAICDDHDELDRFSCPVCGPLAGHREEPDIGPVFIVKYEGRCRGCGDEMDKGDKARMVDGSITCLTCAERKVRT